MTATNQPTNQPTYYIHTYIHTDESHTKKVLEKSRVPVSFHIYPAEAVRLVTGQEISLLDGIEQLRRVDGWGKTRLIKEALAEYIFKHHPGNPGLPLTHWADKNPIPLSEAAKEKLAPKPLEPDYKHMSVPELEAQLKRRFLSEADCMVIRFWIGKKQQETQMK